MRFAITISLAVSLGRYEGGVLLDVSRRLKENNSTNLNEKITIDVINRASAGGMTAVTASQRLP